MKTKSSCLIKFLLAIIFVVLLLGIGSLVAWYYAEENSTINLTKVRTLITSLQTGDEIKSSVQGLADTAIHRKPTPRPTRKPTLPPPTPTPIQHAVTFVHLPTMMLEDEQATFTWYVSGLQKTIHKTGVFFGTTSNPGTTLKTKTPANTTYTQSTKEYLDGNFAIPLQFIGNATISDPGTYYARAYAQIDGKNYWSDEQTFEVKLVPKNEINLVQYPDTIKAGETATFTWEILGPVHTTSYTVIVGGKESRPGELNVNHAIPDTPYSVLVDDFANSSSTVPQRFIGNAYMPESGVYYFRALTFIDNKNVWSEEHTLTVE